MKFKFLLISSVLCFFILSSCERKEQLNDEADILAFTLEPSSLLVSKAEIIDKNINVKVVYGTDITKLKPIFTLSEGATITPSISGEIDFTNPVEFTVTSENKLTQNKYKVMVSFPIESSLYSFEHWKANLIHPFGGILKGEQPVEMDNNNDSVDFWASSNFGYGFLNDEDEKENYCVKAIEGVKGKGVSIKTKEGLAMFGAPIIAGSLFTGSFDVKVMMGTPMKATHFGQPISKEPVEVKGYYAYKSGEKFTDKASKVIEGRKDKGIISAVFYEIGDSITHLDGDNLYTDNHIISKGQFEVSDTDGDGFHEFHFKLEYVENSSKPDFKNKRYKLAIIFSSSAAGADFLGAVGSELKIDEVEVLTI